MYLSLLVMTFKQQFEYRSDVFFTTLGSVLRIYIQVSIWKTLLGHGVVGGNITVSDMVTYTVVAFILSGLIKSGISYILAEKVKLGTISIDLIRPVSLRKYLFFQQLSENAFYALFSCVPVLIFSYFIWGFSFPNITYFLIFLISTCFSIILMFYIEYAIGLLVFWVKDGVYTDFLIGGLFTVFSGTTIPLWFYPDFLVKISNFLPFRLITFEPISIYLGKYTYAQSMNVILMQLLWIGILIILERCIWKAVQNDIFIQGG